MLFASLSLAELVFPLLHTFRKIVALLSFLHSCCLCLLNWTCVSVWLVNTFNWTLTYYHCISRLAGSFLWLFRCMCMICDSDFFIFVVCLFLSCLMALSGTAAGVLPAWVSVTFSLPSCCATPMFTNPNLHFKTTSITQNQFVNELRLLFESDIQPCLKIYHNQYLVGLICWFA